MNRMWMVGLASLLFVGAMLGQLSQSGGTGGSVTVAGLATCDASASVSVSSATTAQAIALAAGKSTYVCGFVMNADGKVAVRLVQGTGSNCATGQSNLTPPFNLESGHNVVMGSGIGRLLKSNAGSAVCVTSSTNKSVNVLLIYTQQ